MTTDASSVRTVSGDIDLVNMSHFANHPGESGIRRATSRGTGPAAEGLKWVESSKKRSTSAVTRKPDMIDGENLTLTKQ